MGVHAVFRVGNFRASQTIAVFGCGPVGLLCMAVAKASGASRIIAIDINSARLDFAKTYAASDVYLSPSIQQGEDTVEYSRRNAAHMKAELGIEDIGPRGIDLVVDASGAEVSIQTAFYIAKCGGTIVQVRYS